MKFKLRAVITGLLSNVKGLYFFLYKLLDKGSGETQSAKYCYDIWLTHFLVANRYLNGISHKDLAEFGPGSSLGVGLAGMLCGAKSLQALDLVPYSSAVHNINVLKGLTQLFKERAPYFPDKIFPGLPISLDEANFPGDVFNDYLNHEYLEKRALEIELALKKLNFSTISYRAPWYGVVDKVKANKDSWMPVDYLFSNAVLEHVEDIDLAYSETFKFLKEGGIATHLVDFGCHSVSPHWNGHWTIGPTLWKIIRGSRPYSINRKALSDHRTAAVKAGFEILDELCQTVPSPISLKDLAPQFSHLSERDICCRNVLLVLRKPTSNSPR